MGLSAVGGGQWSVVGGRKVVDGGQKTEGGMWVLEAVRVKRYWSL
jgi:hypothetical protein